MELVKQMNTIGLVTEIADILTLPQPTVRVRAHSMPRTGLITFNSFVEILFFFFFSGSKSCLLC